MQVCSEVRLVEDHTSAMSVLTIPLLILLPSALDPLPILVTRTTENPFLFVSIARNSGTLQISVCNFMVVLQDVRNVPKMIKKIQGMLI